MMAYKIILLLVAVQFPFVFVWMVLKGMASGASKAVCDALMVWRTAFYPKGFLGWWISGPEKTKGGE